MLCEWSCPLSNGSIIIVFYVICRLPTSTLLGGIHKQLLWATVHLYLLLPRELQPLPEVRPVLLSGAHGVPSVSSQHLFQWVQCGVHHPQPDEACWATSPLPLHSLAAKREYPLLWEVQSCKVSDCNWSEQACSGGTSRLDCMRDYYLT